MDLLPTQETTSTPPLRLSDATKNIQFWSTPSVNNYIQYKRYVNDYLDEDRAPDIAAIQERLQHYTDENADVLNIDTEYLTTKDYIRLASSGRSGWLTDRVINAYATHGIMARNAYINKRCIFPAKPTKNWLILNSYHLHTILCDGDDDPSIKGKYNAVEDNKHLLKKVNFNDYIGLLLPYNHQGNHWILIKVDFALKTITYLDSMHSSTRAYDDFVQVRLKAVRTSYTNRMVRKPSLTPQIPEASWDLISNGEGVSVQPNTYDCGVFTLMFADFITLRYPIDTLSNFSQNYRKMILVQLWNLVNGE